MQVPNITIDVTVGWMLAGNARALWPNTAGWIAFIFGRQFGVDHRNIVLDGHPNRLQNRGFRGPSFGFIGKVWENYKRSR